MTLGHGRTRDRQRLQGSDMLIDGGLGSGVRSGARRAASPYNHTYTEIRDGRGHHQLHGGHHGHHGQHIHLPRGLVAAEDDPVYEEIERGVAGLGGLGAEIQVSDMSDEDGRRQSDMSRQSSRSYGDHRPLIPYSPAANDRSQQQQQQQLIHYGQTLDRGGGMIVQHCGGNPGDYSPGQDRNAGSNNCWEKLRRYQARYELGELSRLPSGYGLPPQLQQQDHSRTVAVLDGHTVVCHLQPQADMYTGRNMPPPSYSEC